MSEPEKKSSDASDGDTYSALYVRVSKVKDLFVDGETKIRIAGDAKEAVSKYLDDAVKKAVKEIIALLPRKSKGDNKGELSRITIQADDFK